MTNKIQSLIVEIERAERTRKTMIKRIRKQGEVMRRAKRYLKATGIRPYRKSGQELRN